MWNSLNRFSDREFDYFRFGHNIRKRKPFKSLARIAKMWAQLKSTLYGSEFPAIDGCLLPKRLLKNELKPEQN